VERGGGGNGKALFLAAGVQVVGQPRKIGGARRHLTFRVRQGELKLRAVAWNMADRARELMADGGACCLAFTPRLNEWNGVKTVDLEVTDLRPGATAWLA